MFKKILLPVDGSGTCEVAYRYAQELSENHGSELVLLNVRERFTWDYENTVPFLDQEIKFKKEYAGQEKELGTESFKESYGNEEKEEIVNNKDFHEEYAKKENQVEDHDFKDAYVYTSDEIINKVSTKISSRILHEAQLYFKEHNIPVEGMVTKGDPAEKIMEIAEKENFDLIIMCTHGMSAMKRFTLGSVTNKVVQHAKTPVLVLRSCEEE